VADWRIKYIDDAVCNRDAETLTAFIRAGDLAPEVRSHLADVLKGLLTGQIKFPKKRPPKRELRSERQEIAEWVWELKKSKVYPKVENIVDYVAKELGCSTGKVWACWRGFNPAHYEDKLEQRQYDAMLDEAREALAKAAVEWLKENEGDREFTDEEIEDAAQHLSEEWAKYEY
jgi:hypothetical protein